MYRRQREDPSCQRSSPRFRLRATLLLAAYTLFLLVMSSHASLWGDEGFTAGMVALPWATMWSDLRHIDINMAAYYTLTRAAVELVGPGEVGLRLVSVTSAVASVPLLGMLTTRLLGRRVGESAALLLLLNPATATVALSARPYALLLCGSILSTLALLRASARGGHTDWLLWALLSSLLLYVHLLGILIVGAHLAQLIHRRRRIHLRRAAGAALPVLLLSALPTALFIAPGDTLNWVPSPTPALAARAAFGATGGLAFGSILLIGAAMGAIRLGSMLRSREAASEASLILWSAIVPVAATVVLLPRQSLLVDLYLTPLLAPLSALAALSASDLRAARPQIGAALAGITLLASSGTLAAQVLRGTLGAPQDWRQATAVLTLKLRPGDAVAFPDTFYRIVAEQYASTSPSNDFRVAAPMLPTAPWGSLRPYQLDRIKRLGRESSDVTLFSQAAGRTSIWIVGPDEPLVESASRRLLAAGWHKKDSITVRGVVLLHLMR